MEQRNFDGPMIINPNESHMALAIMADISGSMEDRMGELNEGINRFLSEVCRDEQTRNILDVAIVPFNDTYSDGQEFAPVEYVEPVNLTASGGTVISPAINTVLDMLNERSRFYYRSGAKPYKPWVLFITDGKPNDNIDAITRRIKEMEENGKVSFRSLGVEGYNSDILHKLSGPKVMRLEGTDFTNFFDWVHKSIRTMSEKSPEEKQESVDLTGNVKVDLERKTGHWN